MLNNDTMLNNVNERQIINYYTGKIYSYLGLLYIILSSKNIETAQLFLFPQIMYILLGIYYLYFV